MQDELDDRVEVDGVGDGLAHAHVVQGVVRIRRVDVEEQVVGRREGHHAHTRKGLEVGDEGRRHGVDPVHGAGLESGDPGRVLGDDLDDEAVGGRPCRGVPVVLEAFDDEFLAGLARHELPGARADGVRLHAGIPDCLEVLPRNGKEGEVQRYERAVRGVEHDVEAAVVQDDEVADVAEAAGVPRDRVALAFVGVAEVRRREDVAVVKPDVLAQGHADHGVGPRLIHFPALGQPVDPFEVRIDREKLLVEEVREVLVHPGGGTRRIDLHGLRPERDDDLGAVAAGRESERESAGQKPVSDVVMVRGELHTWAAGA